MDLLKRLKEFFALASGTSVRTVKDVASRTKSADPNAMGKPARV